MGPRPETKEAGTQMETGIHRKPSGDTPGKAGEGQEALREDKYPLHREMCIDPG